MQKPAISTYDRRHGGNTLVGHSNFSQIFRVDPATGNADEIPVDLPLRGFLEGIAMHNRTLYILTPSFDAVPEMVQVVKLGKNMRNGKMLGIVTDPDMDGVASGAMFGSSLYVSNSRYFADPVSQKWITSFDIHAVE